MSKLTITQLKTHLQLKTKEELIKEIADICNTFDYVKDFYGVKILPDSSKEILNKHKKIILNEFFPSRGFTQSRLSVARKAVNDFKKVSISAFDTADIMIYYVETGVLFTNEYGDIDEPFYCSMESMYESALRFIIKENLKLEFEKRCKKIVDDTDGIGWGFHDTLGDTYYEYFGKD